MGSSVIKIGYVVSRLPRAGPTNQLYYLVTRLDPGRFRPFILTLSPERAESLRPEFEAAGVAVESLGLEGWGAFFDARRRVQAWLSANHIDLLHTQGIRADRIAAVSEGIPWVATLRNYPYDDYLMTYGVLGRVMAPLHCAALRRGSLTVAVSEGVRDAMATRGIRAKVVHNGVDVVRFSPASEGERQVLRSKLGLPSDETVVVSVGHLSSRKNMKAVIEAVLRLVRGRVVLIGDGPMFGPLKERYGANARVHLMGRQSNVSRWLRAADVFMSASRAEGLPNAVMEAMACGLPCVLSDIPSHRELLEPEPGAGVIVNGEDVDGMVAALERLSRQCPEAGRAARRAAENHFSATAMTDAYQRIYAKAVSGNSS